MWPALKRLLIQPFLSANGQIQTTLLVSTRVTCPYKAVGWSKIFHVRIWLHPPNSTNKNYREPAAAPHQEQQRARFGPEGFCPERGNLPHDSFTVQSLRFLSIFLICYIRSYHLKDARQKKKQQKKKKAQILPREQPLKDWNVALKDSA